MAEDKAGIQESSLVTQIITGKDALKGSHIDPNNPIRLTNPDEQRIISRRNFLRTWVPSAIFGGGAALAWLNGWKLPWGNKNNQEDGSETVEVAPTLTAGQMTDLFGQIKTYFKPDYEGEFAAASNDNSRERLAKRLQINISQTSAGGLENNTIPLGMTIGLPNLRVQLPNFMDINGEMVYGEDGKLVTTILKGHLLEKDVPKSTGIEEEDRILLTEALDKVFKIKSNTFRKAPFSNEVYTDDAKQIGNDSNGNPLMSEVHLTQASAHLEVENFALLAINPKGGFILQISPPQHEADKFPNAKG